MESVNGSLRQQKFVVSQASQVPVDLQEKKVMVEVSSKGRLPRGRRESTMLERSAAVLQHSVQYAPVQQHISA